MFRPITRRWGICFRSTQRYTVWTLTPRYTAASRTVSGRSLGASTIPSALPPAPRELISGRFFEFMPICTAFAAFTTKVSGGNRKHAPKANRLPAHRLPAARRRAVSGIGTTNRQVRGSGVLAPCGRGRQPEDSSRNTTPSRAIRPGTFCGSRKSFGGARQPDLPPRTFFRCAGGGAGSHPIDRRTFFRLNAITIEPDSSKNFSWVGAMRGNRQDALRWHQEHFSGWWNRFRDGAKALSAGCHPLHENFRLRCRSP